MSNSADAVVCEHGYLSLTCSQPKCLKKRLTETIAQRDEALEQVRSLLKIHLGVWNDTLTKEYQTRQEIARAVLAKWE